MNYQDLIGQAIPVPASASQQASSGLVRYEFPDVRPTAGQFPSRVIYQSGPPRLNQFVLTATIPTYDVTTIRNSLGGLDVALAPRDSIPAGSSIWIGPGQGIRSWMSSPSDPTFHVESVFTQEPVFGGPPAYFPTQASLDSTRLVAVADLIRSIPSFVHVQSGALGRATPPATGPVTVDRLRADLDAAIAHGVPASIIANLRQQLAAAQAATVSGSADPRIGGSAGVGADPRFYSVPRQHRPLGRQTPRTAPTGSSASRLQSAYQAALANPNFPPKALASLRSQLAAATGMGVAAPAIHRLGRQTPRQGRAETPGAPLPPPGAVPPRPQGPRVRGNLSTLVPVPLRRSRALPCPVALRRSTAPPTPAGRR
jgi:hypothetical protein